jgi:Lrp/AsnC family leucine-responsive transcriptional regulator
MGLVVFVEISLTRTGPDVFAQLKQAAIRVPEIQECHLVSGNFDYLIKARVADMEHYRALLGETILALPGTIIFRCLLDNCVQRHPSLRHRSR